MTTQATLTMTTQEVAEQFNKLAQEGKWDELQDTLFSEDAVSIEPAHSKGLKTVKGIKAIKQKGKDWGQMIESVQSAYTSAPLVAGDYFTLVMGGEFVFKGQGVQSIHEVCVYHVQNGKIVSEQFFY